MTNGYSGEKESEFLNKKPDGEEVEKSSWRGIPGVNYEHISRVRQDRIKRWLGPDGAAVTTEKFQWNRFSETALDRMRKAKQDSNVDKIKELIENSGATENIGNDLALKEAVSEAEHLVDEEARKDNPFSNALKKYQDRLEIITSEIPGVFKNIAGAGGAEMYFLVQSGTRAENDQQIFEQFRSLNNTSGDTHMEHLYSRLGGVIEGHDDKNFFGWKVTVDGHDFVFIWNPDESDMNEKQSDKTEVAKNDKSKEIEEEQKDAA